MKTYSELAIITITFAAVTFALPIEPGEKYELVNTALPDSAFATADTHGQVQSAIADLQHHETSTQQTDKLQPEQEDLEIESSDCEIESSDCLKGDKKVVATAKPVKATAKPVAADEVGGPQISSCKEIERVIPRILKFVATETNSIRTFKCLGAWRTEGPDARAAWIKYRIGNGAVRVCEVFRHEGGLKRVKNGDLKGAREMPGTDPLVGQFYMKRDGLLEESKYLPEEITGGGGTLSQDIQEERFAEGARDDTDEEIANLQVLPLSEMQLAQAPAEFDVRTGRTCRSFERGNQGTCGACWAWAVAASYSASLCYQTDGKVDIALSEESLLDCSHDTDVKRFYAKKEGMSIRYSMQNAARTNNKDLCNGGNFQKALVAFDKKVVTRECNPYEANWSPGQCGQVGASCRKFGFGADKNLYSVNNDLPSMRAALYTYGPAYVHMHTVTDFHHWRLSRHSREVLGVYGEQGEDCTAGKITHAMTMFGYTRSAWIIANSWGPTWGENGYFRVQSGRNCLSFESRNSMKTLILDAASFKFCEDKSPCKKGGHFDANCNCQCRGAWQGPTCESCELQCKNGGIRDPETCTCRCTAANVGKTCDTISARWMDKNKPYTSNAQISWALSSDAMDQRKWNGKARIGRGPSSGRTFSNGISTTDGSVKGARWYEITNPSGAVSLKYWGFKPESDPTAFFVFEVWLGKNEFGSDKGWLRENIDLKYSEPAQPRPEEESGGGACDGKTNLNALKDGNQWTDANCNAWINAKTTRCAASNYQANCALKCCQVAKEAGSGGGGGEARRRRTTTTPTTTSRRRRRRSQAIPERQAGGGSLNSQPVHQQNHGGSPKCWIKMPTGCARTLSEPGSQGTGLNWFIDPQSPNSAKCTARITAYNNYCGKSDAMTKWQVYGAWLFARSPPSGGAAEKAAAEKAAAERAAAERAAAAAEKAAAEKAAAEKAAAERAAAERAAAEKAGTRPPTKAPIPGIKYVGSLSNPKAHPYVYPSRSSAAAACRKSGYKGLCSRHQVDGFQACHAGWMTDYKGYWMSKTVRGCGSGRGFRSWGAGSVGAYCCDAIKYIGHDYRKAHPYAYPSRSSATKACHLSGYAGLCSKAMVDGYEKCAAGWMTDYKGYWMSKTVQGCGSGRGWRGWGAGNAGAYCCTAPPSSAATAAAAAAAAAAAVAAMAAHAEKSFYSESL